MAEVPASPSAIAADPWSPAAEFDSAPRAPWGPWASIGWTALAALAIGATRAIGVAVARQVVGLRGVLDGLASDGALLALATLATLPVVLAPVLLLVRIRGWRAGDYLALRPATGRAVVLANSGLILGLALSAGLTIVLDRPIIIPIRAEAIFATPLWLLSLAVVVAAPILEEVLFRGFLYRGLADSPRLGPGMAIGITAIAWSALHVEHDLYGIATVYLIGLYLGAVRHYSGSLVLTIFLHGVANTVAVAEAVIFAG